MAGQYRSQISGSTFGCSVRHVASYICYYSTQDHVGQAKHGNISVALVACSATADGAALALLAHTSTDGCEQRCMPQCFINMQFNCAYSGSRMLWDGHDHRSRFTAASMEISPGAKWTVKTRCWYPASVLVPSTPIFSPIRRLVAQKL